jgi:hypothetical protein
MSNLSQRSSWRSDLGLIFYDQWLFLFFNNLEEVKIHLNDRQDFGSCESKNGCDCINQSITK